jgi:hypothetical protein
MHALRTGGRRATRSNVPARQRARPALLCIATAWLLMVYAGPAAGQSVQLTPTLDGYVRADRFFGVRVTGEGLPGTTLRLSSPGVFPVELPITAGRIDATVPLLPVGDALPDTITWTADTATGAAPISLKRLGADDRLVLVGGDPAIAAPLASALFPRKRAVTVRLDSSRPRPLWPPAAFASADLVLLDPATATRVDEGELSVLLGNAPLTADEPRGGCVAIASTAMPSGGWPWRQVAGAWVLSHDGGGLAGRAGISADAFEQLPTSDLNRGRPLGTRRTIVLVSGAAAIVLLAAMLLPRRFAALSAFALAGALIAAAFWAAGRLPRHTSADGLIVSWDGKLALKDRWTYLRARSATTVTLAVEQNVIARPVYFSRKLLEATPVRLRCDGDGTPAEWVVDLRERNTLAFVARCVSPAAPPEPTRFPARSPLGILADRYYPGQLVGEVPGAGESDWGTVINRR